MRGPQKAKYISLPSNTLLEHSHSTYLTRSKPSNRLHNPHGGNRRIPSIFPQTRRLQNKDMRKLQTTPIYCAYSQMGLVLKDTYIGAAAYSQTSETKHLYLGTDK